MHQTGSDITRLILAARQNDRAALERLLGLYRNLLTFLARAGIDESLQGKADPSDVVQEAMLGAYRAFGEFRGRTEAELTAWLRRILARTLALLARRYHTSRRRVARERRFDEIMECTSRSLGGLAVSDGSSPSQAAAGREMSVILADALAGLSQDHRDVVVLRNVEELGWDQVARRMGRSADAVRMLWTRALRELRPLIAEK